MKFIDVFTNILLLLGGLGSFLFGLFTLSDSLDNFAGGNLKKIFEKITGNKVKGVLVGAGSTAIMQSSSATTVLVVGFVNAGLLTLSQATPVIMGANIGTTVTAFIMSLPISEFVAALGCIGAFMLMFSKNQRIKKIATVIIGLGLIFVGLLVMSRATVPFSGVLQNFFIKTGNPFLLFIIGLVFTAIIQSSSATTGILIAFAGTVGTNGLPIISISQSMFVLLGVNIGTCITAFLASLGTTTNAKRTALIHIMFNVFGAVFFFILLLINPVKNFAVKGLQLIPNTKMQIAVFHIVFNIITTVLLLPLSNGLVKLSEIFIREKPIDKKEKFQLKYLNDLILSSPSIAVAQIKKEILYMGQLSGENFKLAITSFLTKNIEKKEEFYTREENLNFLNHKITEYLIKISALDISYSDGQQVGSFYHVVSDIERIGDYSENVMKYLSRMINENIEFSDTALSEISDMYNEIFILYGLTTKCFETLALELIPKAEVVEDRIDDYKKQLSLNHIKRLNEGICSPVSGQIYFLLVANMERIADHMINVCHSIIDYAKK